jgi:hypothetical protein
VSDLTGDPHRSAKIRQEISSPPFLFERREKGREERTSWPIYRRDGVGRGLGLGLREESDGTGSSRARAGLLPEEGDDPDKCAPLISVWRNSAA